jgi:signal recognition particle subunit SRP54
LFDNLSERLGGILDRLTGRGALSEADVDAAMREVRRALLEADVALEVVRAFTDRVREQAVGATVVKSVTPGQMVVKIVHDELVATLGSDGQTIDLNAVPPVAIMMVGLQGSGKTTTTAKLARRMTQRDKRKVLMASLDIYRPAAMEQLAVLGRDLDIRRCRSWRARSRRRSQTRAGSRQARRLRRGAARHRRPHHARRRNDERGGRDQIHGQSA